MKVGFESHIQIRSARYAATDFCKGEGAMEVDGRKYSPSSTQFTEKCYEK